MLIAMPRLPDSAGPAPKEPSITMKDFFALPLVQSLQNAQKASRYGSATHRAAFERMKAEGKKYGAERYFGDY